MRRSNQKEGVGCAALLAGGGGGGGCVNAPYVYYELTCGPINPCTRM